jgi:hypothetical protein
MSSEGVECQSNGRGEDPRRGVKIRRFKFSGTYTACVPRRPYLWLPMARLTIQVLPASILVTLCAHAQGLHDWPCNGVEEGKR